MIVTGTYENGRVKLPESVRLKHARVAVKVDIPDEEIDADAESSPETKIDDPLDYVSDEGVRSMVRKLREIRGFGPTYGSGLSDKELLEDAHIRKADEESSRA